MRRLVPLLGLMPAALACGPGQAPSSNQPPALILNHVNVVEHLDAISRAASSAERELALRRSAALRSAVTGGTRDQKTLAAIRRIEEEELATYDVAKATALFGRFAKNGTWVCPAIINTRARASLDDDRFTNDPRTSRS